MWGDITDGFTILDERLVYVDSPLEGFLRALDTSELFVFRCSNIVPDLVWHWFVLPAGSIESEVEALFAAARTNPPNRWMSIIEDRRGEKPRLYAAWLTGKSLPPQVQT